MTLLLPELERRLRAAARAQIAAGGTQSAGGSEPAGRHARRVSLGNLVAAGGIALALVVGVAALALLHAGSHAPAARLGPAAPRATTSFGVGTCVQGGRGRPVRLAAGVVDGHRWALEGLRQPPATKVGLLRSRLVLAGRAYPVCPEFAQLGLVALAPHAIAFGFVPGTDVSALRVAGRAPAVTRQIDGGTFFIVVLARPACGYDALTVSGDGPGRSSFSVGTQFGRCRPGRLVGPWTSGPNATAEVPPAGLSSRQAAEFSAGSTVAGQSGCLACHVIGSQGNNGPGPDLTGVGRRLRPTSIRAALIDPLAPMPSFKHLPAGKLRALVYFLSQLRG